jgi:hypothetical protein
VVLGGGARSRTKEPPPIKELTPRARLLVRI